MKKLLLNILFFFILSSYAQEQAEVTLLKNYKKVDKQIMDVEDSFTSVSQLGEYINKNFENDEYKCRAIYKWITANVAYDVKSMYSISLKIKKGELAEAAFRDKKAICMGYALLFDTLCELNNIRCQYIVGSTKQSWLVEPTGHSWNAVCINNNWFLVDATWGAGYIEEKKFYKSINNSFFLADGKSFYPTHHPIDAIWQLIDYPHDLFYFFNQSKKKTVSLKWNCQDSIEVYLKQEPIDQIVATQRRLKLNGTNSNFTSDYYIYLENLKGHYVSREFKKINDLLSKTINEYNQYVKFKNNRFTPELSDEDLKTIFSTATNYLKESNVILNTNNKYKVESQNENSIYYKGKIEDLQEKIKTETEFVKKYIETKKSDRKTLFNKKNN